MNDRSLPAYYARRVHEYEQIYQKPERQATLAKLKAHLAGLLAGHDVLEIACGAGYWTTHLAPVARTILATDAVPDVLQVARAKPYPPGKVQFQQADAYALDTIAGRFTAGFAGFWWSHLLKADVGAFLKTFHRRLHPGALVVFIDNSYVKGSSTPIHSTDADGNTYQDRRLADGSRHCVLKNFPTDAELRAAVAAVASNVAIEHFTYYWCLSYRVGC